MRGLGLLLGMIVPLVAIAECPDGYTEYLGTSSTQVRNSNGVCVDLCGTGITSLNTSNGYKFDLFASRNTTPSIHVKYGDVTCYADLIAGQSDGTLNVAYNNSVYHATLMPGEICPAGDMFKITYDCGDGATGTPPDSKSFLFGDLYMAPYTAGGCVKPGYSFSGWKIDNTTLTRGEYYNYTYEEDKTMVAQWKANVYGAPYICDNGTIGSKYVNGTYGSSVTSSSDACGTTFEKWRVLDNFCNDTGDTIARGASFTWEWPSNVRFVPARKTTASTLKYSCGDGATGTAPTSVSIKYNEVYMAPYMAGGCVKPGYSFSGWKIDDTTLTRGAYYNYTYEEDKTMVAQWTANVYGGAYLCNNGTYNSGYLITTFGGTVTPSSTVCSSVGGATFAGWRINDVFGNDTGDTVASGASFTWIYPYNIQLVAIWE